MKIDLEAMTPVRKNGNELFHSDDKPLSFDMLSFWQCSMSDLVSNATRGLLAEFLVAKALGLKIDVRNEWNPFDLETSSGLKIEVKSAGYIQSWRQDKLSTITFNVRQTREWYPKTGKYAKAKKRQADVYVFAVLAHQDKATIDPMNVEQWDFYVVKSPLLGERKTIRLSVVQKVTEALKYFELPQVISKLEK